jgi:leucyl-tRNA---protein transferase
MPACHACSKCESLRIPVNEFVFSKSQKRILQKNKNLRRLTRNSHLHQDHFPLFKSYVQSRHSDGSMADMTEVDFIEMMTVSCVKTKLVDYRDENNTLIACCSVDELDDGLSLVYSFFSLEDKSKSLGIFIILDLIEYCKMELKLPYVYLGYAVQGSPKMQYKFNFKPHEVCRSGIWHRTEKSPEEI